MNASTTSMTLMDALATAWQYFGVECVIFAVTATFVLLARNATPLDLLQPRKSKPAVKSSKSSISMTSSTPELKEPARANPSSGALPAKAHRRAEKGSNPVRDEVDVIMRLMRGPSSQRAAGEALKVYAQVRKRLLSPDGAQQLSGAVLVELFTTLVQCAVRSGQCHLVEQLVDDMKESNAARTVPFYESAMKQLAGQKKYREALAVYERMEADGLEPSAATCSCLVSFANELGDEARAQAFFEKLASAGTPSIRAYMTMLRVKSRQQDFAGSVELLKHMRERDVPCDSLVLNVVLATGVAAGQQAAAAELLAQMDASESPVSDTVSYNTVIKGHAQAGEGKAAVEAIQRMQQRGLRPNAISFNTAMDAYVRASEPAAAWEVLQEMRASGLQPDKFSCSILVKGVSKQPDTPNVTAVLDLFDEVRIDETLRSFLYNLLLDRVENLSDESVRDIVSRAQKQSIKFSAPANKRLQALLSKRSGSRLDAN